jgi:hypothetical protein
MIAARWVYLLAAFVLGTACGAGIVRHSWQAEQLRTAQASVQRLKELQNDKDQAIMERDALLADADARARDNRALLERLRSAERGNMPNGSGGACERHLRECRGLLSEGAGLLNEGGELVGKLNADRAAVRRLVK